MSDATTVPTHDALIWLWHPHDKVHFRARVVNIVMDPSNLRHFQLSVIYEEDGRPEHSVQSREIQRVAAADGLAREAKGGFSISDRSRTWFYDSEKEAAEKLATEKAARRQERSPLKGRRRLSKRTQRRWLELFAGSGVISEAARAVAGASTVMTDSKHDSNVDLPRDATYHRADLSNRDTLRRELSGGFDVVWAAPPCTTGSQDAAHVHGRTHDDPEGTTREALEANALVATLLEEVSTHMPPKPHMRLAHSAHTVRRADRSQLERALRVNRDLIIFVETSG